MKSLQFLIYAVKNSPYITTTHYIVKPEPHKVFLSQSLYPAALLRLGVPAQRLTFFVMIILDKNKLKMSRKTQQPGFSTALISSSGLAWARATDEITWGKL